MNQDERYTYHFGLACERWRALVRQSLPPCHAHRWDALTARRPEMLEYAHHKALQACAKEQAQAQGVPTSLKELEAWRAAHKPSWDLTSIKPTKERTNVYENAGRTTARNGRK